MYTYQYVCKSHGTHTHRPRACTHHTHTLYSQSHTHTQYESEAAISKRKKNYAFHTIVSRFFSLVHFHSLDIQQQHFLDLPSSVGFFFEIKFFVFVQTNKQKNNWKEKKKLKKKIQNPVEDARRKRLYSTLN